MYTVNQIRSKFLEYFQSKNHTIVNSSPLVPHNDPTLMFTNAGMVQFKDVFTQNETRSYVKATSSQKCVRAGGKHNDLDNVGYTARHHTFFEMLGNFSFGDYFKEDAIKFAWEFLTKELQIPEEKLSVTVYHTDTEAFDIWKRVTNLKNEKILKVPTSDNFWAMGDTGPCGPCSEIFYDHGEEIPGRWSLDENGNDLFEDRFIEIWNLVFMQYEKLESGEQIDLPSPSIDTGMGLERIAAILQGKHDNYDIDLFEKLINESKKATGNSDEKNIASHRIISDHLRSISFLLADGVMPSNEGRGYVLRRIMRRAMRHARQLGCKKPVIFKLVRVLVELMGEAYPELKRAESLITEIIKLEEERFGETLDRGLKLLDEESSKLNQGDKLPGHIAFKLYDTYGFPYDLTVDILKNHNIAVDEEGFKNSMQEQKERARAAWKGSGEKATSEVWFNIKEQNGATEFLGYETDEAQAKILSIIVNNEQVQEAYSNDDAIIILNQTPFYGESGGQEGDKGTLEDLNNNCKINVSDTKKMLGSIHAHIAKIESGQIKVNDIVTAKIDITRRDKLRANHSATHIIHSVLRDVLGKHVTQKGSLVAEDKLRFDISHPKAVTKEELKIVEEKVNGIIKSNSSVGTCLMTPDEAIESGAMALFGEKYGDEVRVVSMGDDYSIELCGGTHVKNTSDIKELKIISESAISAGIRRIEAITGDEIKLYNQKIQEKLDSEKKALEEEIEQLKENFAKLDGKISDLNLTDSDLREQVKSLKKAIAKKLKDNAIKSDDIKEEKINDIAFIGKNFGEISPKDLRSIAGDLQKKLGSGVIAVGSTAGGKASIIVSVSNDLTDKVNAVELVQSSTEIIGAKGGGGKANFAQTGGSSPDKVSDAIEIIKSNL